MTITIDVTQSDIDNGICSAPGHCAVALACQRTMPHAEDLCVYPIGGVEWCLAGGETRFRAPLPYHMRAWLDAFDDGRLVAPVSFQLEIESSEWVGP